MFDKIITRKEALINLANIMQKQIVETEWEIERIKPMTQEEFENFQGESAQKGAMEKLLKDKLKERKQNRDYVLKMIGKYKT